MGCYLVPFLAEKGYAVDAVSLDAPDPSADAAGVSASLPAAGRPE